MTGAPGFRDGVTKTSANLTGSGRPTGAIYKDSATTSTAFLIPVNLVNLSISSPSPLDFILYIYTFHFCNPSS